MFFSNVCMLTDPSSMYPERTLFNFRGLGGHQSLPLSRNFYIVIYSWRILIILHYAWFSSIQDGVVTLDMGGGGNMLTC